MQGICFYCVQFFSLKDGMYTKKLGPYENFPLYCMLYNNNNYSIQSFLMSIRGWAGLRVVRGRDWQFGDEDGGEGHVGTVVEIGELIDGGRRVVVQWDCGKRCNYRCGDGKFELRILKKNYTGYGYPRCVSCNTWGVMWKCVKCTRRECHLCNSCYMAGKVAKKNCLKHEFRRNYWR